MEAGMVPNEAVLMNLVLQQQREVMALNARCELIAAVYRDLRDRAEKAGVDVSDPRVVPDDTPPAPAAEPAPADAKPKPPANRTARRASPPRKSSGRKRK